MKSEGLIHEITSRVQKLRKEVCLILIIYLTYSISLLKAKIIPTDSITVYYSVEPETCEIARIASEQGEEIRAILKKPFLPISNLANEDRANIVITKRVPVSSI